MKPTSHSFLIVLTLVAIESVSQAGTTEARKERPGTAVLSASESPSALAAIAPAVEQAIGEGKAPGAVVLVGHQGQIVYLRAFGHRALVPQTLPMTADTLFDLASLTKVVATTTAVMQLVEQGKIRLNDPVAKYIPAFAQNGKADIAIRDLLTHYSGLPPDLDLSHPWTGREVGYSMAFGATTNSPPETRFVYSDIDFIVLGALVERVSGSALNTYCEQKIFSPLSMTHTRFQPPKEWRGQIAPTEYDERG